MIILSIFVKIFVKELLIGTSLYKFRGYGVVANLPQFKTIYIGFMNFAQFRKFGANSHVLHVYTNLFRDEQFLCAEDLKSRNI